MSRDLPPHPDLEFFKNEAKELLQDLRKGHAAALEQWCGLDSAEPPARPKLADAQQAIASEYGFANWGELKDHIQSPQIRSDSWEDLSAAVLANDAATAAQLVKRNPDLKHRLNSPLP